jgi:uracil-DNA glycosylase
VIQASPEAKILIAGQAPGLKVHQTGIPFNDPSGKRLREWMGVSDSVFYDPTKIALVPMALCFPGTSQYGDLPPPPICATTWRSRIIENLPKIQLTLVLGQYAHAYHFNGPKRSISERVKQWKDYWPELVPLPHPSPRNNRWLKQHPWFEAELVPLLQGRVREVLKQG